MAVVTTLGKEILPGGRDYLHVSRTSPNSGGEERSDEVPEPAVGYDSLGRSDSGAASVSRKVVHRVPRREWAHYQLVGAAGSCEQLSGCARLPVSLSYGRLSAAHSSPSCPCPRTRLKPLCARSRATAIQRATWLVSSCQRQTRPMVPRALPITFSM